MSTIVCQSVAPSGFESQPVETTAVLKLKVAETPPAAGGDRSTNLEFGNWGFLQTGPRETGDFMDIYYANSWAKKSSLSTLSAKSLELCTESLGSETGSDIMSDGGDAVFSYPPPPQPPLVEHSDVRSRGQIDCNCERYSNPPRHPNRRESRSFPPPLTTMSGTSSLQVRRHREGGRLIIEAVEAPFRNAYLQAERSDGRLRLRYLTAEATTSSAAAGEEEDEDKLGDETTAAAEEEQIEDSGDEGGSEFETNSNSEMEVERCQWLSRCKEEGGGGSNWKPPFWLAIS